SKPPLWPATDIVLGLGLYRIGEWTLAPYSPSTMAYGMRNAKKYSTVNPLGDFLSTPKVVKWKELSAKPDNCAMRLVRELYYDFGYDDDQVPTEYDAVAQELIFPA